MGPSVLERRPLLKIASGPKAEKGDAVLFPDTSRSSRSVLNLQEPDLSALNHRGQHWYAKVVSNATCRVLLYIYPKPVISSHTCWQLTAPG